MSRTLTASGSRASVAAFNGVRHGFVTAVPHAGGSLAAQLEQALVAVRGAARELGLEAGLYHQAVFVADHRRIPACRALVETIQGADRPATTFVPQPPVDGAAVAVEAWLIETGPGAAQVERVAESVARVSFHGLTWCLAAQAEPRPGTTGVFNQTTSALSVLRGQLARAGVGLEHVLRTWYYLGEITEPEDDTERYKELNRARGAFYEGVHFLADCVPPGQPAAVTYPASTGIGSDERSLRLSALALQTERPDVSTTGLENPQQTSAFQYAACYSPKSPQFARAMALACGPDTAIFVSGTASITDSETRHIGDVEAQTHLTLDNIAVLIAEDNLRRHSLPGRGVALEELALARVYVKHVEDAPRVRAICEARMPDTPMIHVVADVCRPDLLVEIEALAFRAGRTSAP